MPVPPDALEIHAAGDDHCVASWRNVLFTNWRGAVLLEPLAATRGVSFGLAARNPEGVAVYNIIERGIPMPDQDMRNLASQIIRDTGDHLRCTCTTVIAEGIWAGMARAALAGITLLERHSHPQKVFGDLGSAADWAVQFVIPAGTTAAQLLAHVDTVRRAGLHASD